MKRLVIAFLVAPFAAPVLLIPYIRSMTTTPTWFVFALIISTIVTYVGVFIFGVPVYLALRSRNWTALWIACLLGAAIGVVMWLIFSVAFALVLDEGMAGVRLALTDSGALKGVIWPGAVVGAVVGAAFWLIARPDHQTS
jgi:uncharacterized protein with PQ loop repeat